MCLKTEGVTIKETKTNKIVSNKAEVMMELTKTILDGTIKAFNLKGMKFTMDDIASILGMSKKTIYTVFRTKDELLLAMVDYVFDSIKDSEREIIENTEMTTIEKVKSILGVLPEGYRDIDFGQLYLLKDKYPKIYEQVENRLETGWDATIVLLEQGIREGVIRPIKIPIMKIMFESSLEQFFQRDVLVRHKISYKEALDQVVEIFIDGIIVH